MVCRGGEDELHLIAQALPLIAEPLAHFKIEQGVEHAVGTEECGQLAAQQGAGVHGVRFSHLGGDVQLAGLGGICINHPAENSHAGRLQGQDILLLELPPLLFVNHGLHSAVQCHETAGICPGYGDAGLVDTQPSSVVVQPFPGIEPIADDIIGAHAVAGAGAELGQQAHNTAVSQVHGPGDKLGAVLQRPHAAAEEHDRRGKMLGLVPLGGKHVHAQRDAIGKTLPDEGGRLVQHAAVPGFSLAAGVA